MLDLRPGHEVRFEIRVELTSRRGLAICLGLLFGVTSLSSAQNTSFTYQGRLIGPGGPADGTYDIRFALYTNALGTIATGVLTNSAVAVSSGLFTTSLDFGNVFDGTAYWLELGVRPSSLGGDFSVLAPRQALTAAPYALQAAGRPNSPVELLGATHIGPTTSTSYHGFNPGSWLNLGAGASGMLRQIEFTSAPGSNNCRVLMTNYFLRVYVDAGTITNLGNAPARNLLVNAPLAVLLGDKYRPSQPSFIQATGSRYLGYNEYWDSTNGNGAITFNLTLPMPFTNGILVGLFDTSFNALIPWGYSYVSYEQGPLPADLRSWRLRTGFASGSYGDSNNITFLNTTNSGELVSIYTSFRHLNNDHAFLEGIWFIQSDGVQAPLGSSGGEDLFNNGYYFLYGPQITYNYGTIHLETPFAVEAYRHFSGADAFYWRSSATAFYQNWLTVGTPVEADILCFYYSK